jgi:hypothetical protein
MATFTFFADPTLAGALYKTGTPGAITGSDGGGSTYGPGVGFIFTGSETGDSQGNMGFLAFDTSTLVGTQQSATITLSHDLAAGANALNIPQKLRAYDFGAGQPDGADWRSGASLLALPLVGSINSLTNATAAWNFPVQITVPASAAWRLVLHNARMEGTANWPTGSSFVNWYSAEQSGTTNDPKLVVVTISVHALTANSLTVGSPTLGTPVLSQKHAATATALTVASPTIGTASLAQKHAVGAPSLAVGSPTFGTPVLAQRHGLGIAAFSLGSPTMGTPALAQAHGLTAASLSIGSPSLPVPVLSQRWPPPA